MIRFRIMQGGATLRYKRFEMIFTDQPSPLKTQIVGSILFLLAFQAALLGLNPSFYMDDSPEIIVAASSLGIAHPPGYPLYLIPARLFSLLPLGPLCLRINLFSAVTGAACCLALFLILRKRFNLGLTLSSAFGLLWMAGATAYPAALSAKNGIYQLTSLFLLLVLTALLRGRHRLAFFLFGLSLGGHWMSMVSYGLGFAFFIWVQLRERESGLKELIRDSACLILGLSLYLYLPLRSALDPLINWAHPIDLQNFLRHVSRYVDKNKDLTGDPLLWAQQGFFYLKSAFQEFSWMGLLVFLGLGFLWRNDRKKTWGLLLAWGGLFVAVCVFSKFSSQRIYLMQNYSLSSFILIPLFSALGFHWLTSFSGGKFTPGQKSFPILAWALVLGLLAFRLPGMSQPHYTYSYDYVLSAWKSVPKGGLFFSKGDVLDFPCWYFQLLEGKRPDIAVLGAGSLPMDWYRMFLAKTHPDLKVPFPFHEKGKEYLGGHLIQWMVEKNPGRRYFFTYPDLKSDGLGDSQWIPNGLTQEAFFPPDKTVFNELKAENLWKNMRLRHFEKPESSVDQVTWDNFLKDYGMARGWMALKKVGEAEAISVREKNPSTPSSKARALYAQSLPHLLWVRNWDPANPQSAVNVGLVYSYLGKPAQALEWFEKAAATDPKLPETYYYAGMTAFQMGSVDKARELFEKTLSLNPNHPQAQQALQYLKTLKKP